MAPFSPPLPRHQHQHINACASGLSTRIDSPHPHHHRHRHHRHHGHHHRHHHRRPRRCRHRHHHHERSRVSLRMCLPCVTALPLLRCRHCNGRRLAGRLVHRLGFSRSLSACDGRPRHVCGRDDSRGSSGASAFVSAPRRSRRFHRRLLYPNDGFASCFWRVHHTARGLCAGCRRDHAVSSFSWLPSQTHHSYRSRRTAQNV